MNSVLPSLFDKYEVVDFGMEGLHVRRERTTHSTIYIVSADKEIAFPAHAHAEQWTTVLSGSCALTIDGNTTIYKAGDTYHIPANTTHQLTMHAGFSEFDVLDDPQG